MVTPDTGVKNIKEGDSPFYTDDSTSLPGSESQPYYDSPTVNGLAAIQMTVPTPVTAATAGPNNVVATGSNGLLPISVIPPLSGSVIIAATNTYANLKAFPLTGAYFAIATNLGQGALVFNTAIAGIGDSGWVVISGG